MANDLTQEEMDEKQSERIKKGMDKIVDIFDPLLADGLSIDEICIALGEVYANAVVHMSGDDAHITRDIMWGLDGYMHAAKKYAEAHGVKMVFELGQHADEPVN